MTDKPIAKEAREEPYIIPLSPNRVISVEEFQSGTKAAKNKSQKLRVAYRMLASYGAGVNGFWAHPSVKPFIEDYVPTDEQKIEDYR